MDLVNVLRELIPCIKGKWFIGDGALLGLTREKKLISYDNDIDLYFLEDTTIDLTDSILEQQQYYLCNKIYNPNNDKEKHNPWLEYCSIIKLRNPKFNRSQVLLEAKKDYHLKKIISKFTKDHIDIFIIKKNIEDNRYYLSDDATKIGVPYLTEDDLKIKINTDLGFDVNIPNNAEQILERQYGPKWHIPDPNFKYY